MHLVVPFDGFWSRVPVDVQIDDVSKSNSMLGCQFVNHLRYDVINQITVGQALVEFR